MKDAIWELLGQGPELLASWAARQVTNPEGAPSALCPLANNPVSQECLGMHVSQC